MLGKVVVQVMLFSAMLFTAYILKLCKCISFGQQNLAVKSVMSCYKEATAS